MIYVGIDVSKDKHDCYIVNSDGEILADAFTVENNLEGFDLLFQRLKSVARDLDNVKVGLHNHHHYNTLEGILRLPHYRKVEKEMNERAMELLKVFDLEKDAEYLASNLPYGQQRKLEIARALATDPKLLLLDEPAAGMNPQETQELTDFIHTIRDEYSLSILMIEHHMDLVMDIADRIYVLDFGQLIAQGTPDEIQNNERVIDAYLGVADDAED